MAIIKIPSEDQEPPVGRFHLGRNAIQKSFAPPSCSALTSHSSPFIILSFDLILVELSDMWIDCDARASVTWHVSEVHLSCGAN